MKEGKSKEKFEGGDQDAIKKAVHDAFNFLNKKQIIFR